MLTFDEAIKILGSKQEKKIGNNTVLSRTKFDKTVKITLHGHAVIYITQCLEVCGDIYVLYSCGYKTVTTKRRLNKYGPVSVYQKDFVWYTKYGEFIEGQIFNSKGQLIGGKLNYE